MAKKSNAGGGQRALKVRVKTAGKRSLSSKLWLERQLNDPYVARAKREGMRSRAAFKLMEIDDKAHFLKKGARVVDLGAAPGGWAQVAAKRVNAPAQGRVIGIDMEFYKLDNPMISFGHGSYYDYYRLQTKVTRRALE